MHGTGKVKNLHTFFICSFNPLHPNTQRFMEFQSNMKKEVRARILKIL